MALCIAPQLVASIRPKADPAAQSLSIEYFWQQASIKRSSGGDETKRKNYEERTRHIARGSSQGCDGKDAMAERTPVEVREFELRQGAKTPQTVFKSEQFWTVRTSRKKYCTSCFNGRSPEKADSPLRAVMG